MTQDAPSSLEQWGQKAKADCYANIKNAGGRSVRGAGGETHEEENPAV